MTIPITLRTPSLAIAVLALLAGSAAAAPVADRAIAGANHAAFASRSRGAIKSAARR